MREGGKDDRADKKWGFHKCRTIEADMEIVWHTRSPESLTWNGCSLGVKQLTGSEGKGQNSGAVAKILSLSRAVIKQLQNVLLSPSGDHPGTHRGSPGREGWLLWVLVLTSGGTVP